MPAKAAESPFQVFATCPPSPAVERGTYIRSITDVARWSEESGCAGILVYTDNGLVDPWLVSQVIMQNTSSLCPLVAIQPVYMHPYTVAKMITSLGYFYGRRVYLNMVAGGFKNDLDALNDPTPHDRRYDRLIEYTSVIKLLLGGERAVTYAGEFYQVRHLKLVPPLPLRLFPGIFVSGSSEAGLAAARSIGATAVMYPKPVSEYEAKPLTPDVKAGIRVGIIARESGDEAWAAAHARFPESRKGQLAHQLAMKVSDSEWHRQLSKLGEPGAARNNPYWLGPFENYNTFCPYLVGSYEAVAKEIARYVGVGHRTFILDVPPDKEELHHTGVAFKRAHTEAGA